MTESGARWQRLKSLFDQAAALPGDERQAWLAHACGDDEALRDEVEGLVRAHVGAGRFLEHGALAVPGAARVIVLATQPPSPETPAAGTRFGAYRIVRELGRGGMGVVYLGARDDERFEKLVAIKIIAGGLIDPVASGRFLEERRILASLDHPGIARLLDAGTSDAGIPYVVMEHVDGEPIDTYCQARHLTIRERLTLFATVCEAVQYSHERLVVHRDIKARNILVTSEGAAKLLDFGIAKLLEPGARGPDATRAGFRVLTPESASPEQVRGEPVTVATDVYSLGVLLYRLLTGASPYRGDLTSQSAIVRAICEDEPRRPSTVAAAPADRREVRGDLDLITLKALSKDAARRYSSVDHLAQDIRRHLGRLPVLAAPDAWTYRTRKFVTRHWAGLGAAALVMLSLAGGVVATAWQAQRARKAQAQADRRFNDVRRLANSFLFEFHDTIAPLPGSTKARQLVVQRATEYLDSLSKESSRDPTLERELAASYERVGDVQGLPAFANLGDTGGALRSHRQALAIREALASAAPADATLQRELATTLTHVGDLLRATKDLSGALAHARRALAVRQVLYDQDPSSERERRSLAIGYHYLSDVTLAQEDWPATKDNLERETALLQAVLASDQSSLVAQRDVSIAYKRYGALLERNRERTAAILKYRQAIDLDEQRVRANPGDREAKLDLSFGYASVGYALSTVPDFNGSLDNYHRALALRQQVATLDPHDARSQEAVARGHLSLGQVLRKAKRHLEAMAQFRQAADISSRLYAADRGNAGRAERLANVYAALAGSAAELAAATRSRADAAPHWRLARDWATESLGYWTAVSGEGPLAQSAQAEVEGLRQLVAQAAAALK